MRASWERKYETMAKSSSYELIISMYQHSSNTCIGSIYLYVDTVFKSLVFLLQFHWSFECFQVAIVTWLTDKEYMYREKIAWWVPLVEQEPLTAQYLVELMLCKHTSSCSVLRSIVCLFTLFCRSLNEQFLDLRLLIKHLA